MVFDVEAFVTPITEETNVVLTTLTSVKMNKNNALKTVKNPFDKLFKRQKTLVTLNANYQDKVNEERAEEGKAADFEAGARKWGERVNGIIVVKGDQKYLSAIVVRKLGDVTYWTEGGTEVPYEDFAEFIPVAKSAPSPGQDLERPVIFVTYKFDSIENIEFPVVTEEDESGVEIPAHA